MFDFILSLQATQGDTDLLTLYRTAEDKLEDLRHKATLAGIDAQDTAAVYFALAAFIDEVVTGAPWADRTAWPLLQYRHFHTHRAGKRFFDNLLSLHGYMAVADRPDQARDNGYDPSVWRDPVRADVLEVYYSCLLLGFRGELGAAKPEQYQDEMDHIRAHVRMKPQSPLSPHLLPRVTGATARRGWSGWMWATIGLYILAVAGIIALFIFGVHTIYW